jgi:hypothetical protein
MKTSLFNFKSFTSRFFTISALALFMITAGGCEKEKVEDDDHNCKDNNPETQMAAVQNMPISKVMHVAHIRLLESENVNQVMFLENAQVFAVEDIAMLNELRTNFSNKKPVKVTFDPWNGQVLAVSQPSQVELNAAVRTSYSGKDNAIKVDLQTMNDDDFDNASRFGAINLSTGSLTNVIPDLATAQLMFNYLTTQCCAVPGPYTVDYCISFQYAHDGCYARAHKMCDIINNRYNYQTQKVFSFANSGSDVLSVHAQKWGGCCVNWWYHVVPMVSVNTPTGVKAYVFDPAMFNQPVLLSAWLHAQENPTCAGSANVSMINVQPTAMYWPTSYSGYTFGTDPGYVSTNATLVSYASLLTCP